MTLPRINTKATNVELTEERKGLITRKLAPLGRILSHEGDAHVDVVIRLMHSRISGDLFYVSVKVSTPENSYVAVATEPHLRRALTHARETLRRAISRGESVADYSIRRLRMRKQLADAYTLTI